jgi:glycosyltransferase involved in cell wall biosynthesis
MLNETPLVSVIIPNYNYAQYLSYTVESVLAQTYQNIEIIVVDDGSKDNSLEVLGRYKDRIIVIPQSNAGVAAARNTGIERSRGDYLAFLDADDIWKEDKIARQIDIFLNDPSIGMVHVGVEEIDSGGTVLARRFDGMKGWVAKDLLLLNKPVILGGGSGFMVSKRACGDVGGFDPRLSTSADWEFCYRISNKYQVGFIENPLILYRIHDSNMHNNVDAMERDVRLSFEKVFDQQGEDLKAIKTTAYGNFHLMLAGSYLHNEQYLKSFRHSLKAVWFTPKHLAYLLQYPKRLWQKR